MLSLPLGLVRNNERRIAGASLARALPYDAFLCVRIVLKPLDAPSLLDYLGAITKPIDDNVSPVIAVVTDGRGGEALRPTQHDGRVGCERNQPKDNEDGT